MFQTKPPLFLVFALASAWIAIAPFVGVVGFVLRLDDGQSAPILVSGSTFYFNHSIFYTLAMVAGMRKEEDDVNEEAAGEVIGDFAKTSVDDNSPSKVEEDEKQGGDLVEANADNNSLSSAEC